MLTNIFEKKGFSILEIMVVITIFSFGLVGISSLMLQTMRAESLNAGYLKASMFAQEGIELVRGYRDENWLSTTLPDWDESFGNTDGTFTVYYGNAITVNDTADDINDSSTVLMYNGIFYDHVVFGGTPSTFRRLISVSNCTTASSDCWNIESRVDWVTSGRTNSYVAQTELYNWR